MFVVNLRNFGNGSATVLVVGSMDESVRTLPALAQNINENSVTVVPESGLYYAQVENQNMTILSPCNLEKAMEKANFLANGSAFKFADYDSSKGNGTGATAKLESGIRTQKAEAEKSGKIVFMGETFLSMAELNAKIASEGLTEATAKQLVRIATKNGVPA